MGPTASGKSQVALELAQRYPFEIVSVDSALVYRGMDIGTAKPDRDTLARVAHHLIDVVDPTDAYSAGRFRDDALRLMQDITSRGRVPLLVGGTMLYFKALREGLSALPQADAGLRAALEERARREGLASLYRELQALDPLTAARLRPSDPQRIQRALEVCLLTGRPMSQILAQRPANAPYRMPALALVPSVRAALHRRIAQRFAGMLQQGLIEEVRALRQRYALSAQLPSMRAVGYRQVWEHLEGAFDRDALCERAIAATRQLAKRQLTWLRATEDVQVVDCLQPDVAGAVARLLNW